MSANRLRVVPLPALRSLGPNLKTLDLGENSISALPDEWLANFTVLYGLRLAHNKLTNLTEKAFASHSAASIKMLNLASNHIKDISLETFAHLRNLEVSTAIY